MDILVVDDEPRPARRLAYAIRRCGHLAIVAAFPQEALQLLQAHPFHGVIVGERSGVTGTAMARAMRRAGVDTPLTVWARRPMIERGSPVLTVLPREWDFGDIHALAARWQAASQGMLPTSGGALSVQNSTDTLEAPQQFPYGSTSFYNEHRERVLSDQAQSSGEAPAMPARKIRLRCRNWFQVDRLCHAHAAGRNLTIRGQFGLEPSERISVALCLPDQISLSIDAEVLCVRDGSQSTQEFVVHLTGLSREVRNCLQALSKMPSSS